MEMKILLSTLVHNTPDLADNMLNQWHQEKEFINEHCETMIVDNGSDLDKISKSTTHKLEKNVFFGGGCNVIMDYFLSGDYDYLLLFNSDIIYHGYNFLSTAFEEIKKYNLDVYTPSVINGKIEQCKWRTVHNWGTKGVRKVKYIDDQSPIFSRRMVEKLYPFPDLLYLGYGTDFHECIIANRNNFNIGVSDNLTVCHLENYTVQSDKLTTITKQQYWNDNYHNMVNHFENSEYAQEYKDLFSYGEKYNFYGEDNILY